MKKALETAFDIPFSVHSFGSEYIISPKNEMESLFEIRISISSGVRIIIEADPQRHAAGMLKDMASASSEKKALFIGYRDAFIQKGFNVKILVNNSEMDFSEWAENWNNLHIRITKILDDERPFDVVAEESAVHTAGMMLSLLNIVPIDIEETGFADGKAVKTLSTRYERNPLNRELCLQTRGYNCCICGFDFEKKYGVIGRHFIHVHHVEQLALADGPHVINPAVDLMPVCPNCHAMLHTQTPPLLPEQLKKIIMENENR